MKSPFGYLERKVIDLCANGQALKDEQLHYKAVCGLDGIRPMDSINYLYARLNIIDSKASSILSVNTLALGITSLVVTTAGAPAESGSGHVGVGGVLLVLALGMVCCSLIAIVLSLCITRLKFDHVTPAHSLEAYEAAFIDITIARQRILATARLFTGSAFLLYAVLLASTLSGFQG